MSQGVVGWDIGGAHVKAAVVNSQGQVGQVFLEPCPLWKGIEYLDKAIIAIKSSIPEGYCHHIVTMTGELVDLFESRNQGVDKIIQTMQDNLQGDKVSIYAGAEGFISAGAVEQNHYDSIASANWLASASLAAKQLESGLFIDIGSTTTDILVLTDKQVQALGVTDYQRLVSAELVYTGIVRTAVMAVAQAAKFKQQNMWLMAEYFATMADVYRLTGELNEAHDHTDTADGTEKTSIASARRLSRMTGYEFLEGDFDLWRQFALDIKQQQVDKIKSACTKLLARDLVSKQHYFIGAGIGRFLVKQLADDMGYPYIDFSDLISHTPEYSRLNVADCAPAVAVALLYIQK